MTGVSDNGFRYGVLQFGDRIYTEFELGASGDVNDLVSTVVNMECRNDDYNDVPGRYVYLTEQNKCISF